ncbi:MAG: Lacal_2735 family protein [Flavobacteriaceae bacterium]|nr:Lacal_2735 family protein [Flavobacteriaceae bacterium]
MFKKENRKEKLKFQYESLLKEAYKLSSSNRKLSDQMTAEAEEVMKKLEQLP